MLKKFRTTDAAQRHGGVEARVQKSKLTAVSLSSSSVVRTEITDLIARSGSARLILFRAPAGFGKTTAMLQYRDSLQRVGITTAWLTLDPLDDDFRRLLIHLIAAFDQRRKIEVVQLRFVAAGECRADLRGVLLEARPQRRVIAQEQRLIFHLQGAESRPRVFSGDGTGIQRQLALRGACLQDAL